MKQESSAYKVNMRQTNINVKIRKEHRVLEEIFVNLRGVHERLDIFLKELNHPYKNWAFIIKEARTFALDYFHLLKKHAHGPVASNIYTKVFFDAFHQTRYLNVRIDAVDHLLFFLHKICSDADKDSDRFLPVIEDALTHIFELNEPQFFYFVKSYYQLNHLAKKCIHKDINFNPTIINNLLIRFYKRTYQYWHQQKSPQTYFEQAAEFIDNMPNISHLFDGISHKNIAQNVLQLEAIVNQYRTDDRQLTESLIPMPGFNQIVSWYNEMPTKISKAAPDEQTGKQWKMTFLFHMMSIDGLSSIHEDMLREINRTVSWLIDHQDMEHNKQLLTNTCNTLKSSLDKYPAIALTCIQTMGKAVYHTNENALIFLFIDEVISMGFQVPNLQGVGEDWQIRANSVHLKNVTVWLELAELNPQVSQKLLSSLIIHLALSGFFIKDTDLFPREISKLLNSHIEPVYNLIKQLARLFPSYFNEIGAEGRLRDISTEMDEISSRKDRLIHFLRKQSHVESSNQTLDLTESVFKYWLSGDTNILHEKIPDNIYKRLNPDDSHVSDMRKIARYLFKQAKETKNPLSKVLELSDDAIKEIVFQAPDISESVKRKMYLTLIFYKSLHQKYHLDKVNLSDYLEQCQSQLNYDDFPSIPKVQELIEETDLITKVDGLIDVLLQLRKIILTRKQFEARENIYRKRHFTIDIPSMYGSYHEKKFDALALTFRLEAYINVCFEQLVEDVDLELITRASFFQINTRLKLFNKALRIDGIYSIDFTEQLKLLGLALSKRGFTFTQYIDIFKGIARAVRRIVQNYFHTVHEHTLVQILGQTDESDLLPKYRHTGKVNYNQEQRHHRVSEMFFRDRIATSLGLKQLDLFVSQILSVLFRQADKLPDKLFHALLNYDAERSISPLSNPKALVQDVIHMGMKGYNLAKLKGYKLNVPPGFIITTEIFRFREVIENYLPAEKSYKEQITSEIKRLEGETGKEFGNPENPLLLSVRSGSSVSQPGMMDTFLNVGISEKIAEGIARRKGLEWFAWDNYRRFLQIFGMSFGLKRNKFDAMMARFKEEKNVVIKRNFTGNQMRELAMMYKHSLLDEGIDIPDDPMEQLLTSIMRIIDSWNSSRAKTYREIMGISDDWGTAVTVQTMVFGNIHENAGAGVTFTKSLRGITHGERIQLWGDFTPGNQGEDVVAGLVKTHPISIVQAQYESRPITAALESLFPDIYKALKEEVAALLITEKKWGHQEIEFTFEGPNREDLYILQTRDMALSSQQKTSILDISEKNSHQFAGRGIGIGGGAISGRIVFSVEEINHWRVKEPDTHLIVVRNDTVPDDIREINEADGLLTGRGGATSHAAVVAHRLGKTCVVGCTELSCFEDDQWCQVNAFKFRSGDFISIDGNEGSVYSGKVKIIERHSGRA
ncbi:MAG: pyruvate,orthophosphate dikinase [Candidatus Magnetoglobus multicellularis str. Araruama]|uniref:Pyruvate,orthophosphate dikinase n=1 Tax=Candidatus Magnetoglobus multicellularis str. Araruama TaxID=890399 RepID=A0A1V1PCW2_9BACT|nr:MAG: pyruvate,orthophosphate dikinase [Candidatus Magnetoglobus multicellularis str. Araruama]